MQAYKNVRGASVELLLHHAGDMSFTTELAAGASAAGLGALTGIDNKTLSGNIKLGVKDCRVCSPSNQVVKSCLFNCRGGISREQT